jgi:hypothetical protein
MPKNPKFMLRICQNERRGLTNGVRGAMGGPGGLLTGF